MAGRPLRPATDHRFGGPLPRQLANPTRSHPYPINLSSKGHAAIGAYAVLSTVSSCYPPDKGRFSTRYSPIRHSVKMSLTNLQQSNLVRLACVRHAASVHPEPGSNSLKKFLLLEPLADLEDDPGTGTLTFISFPFRDSYSKM